jgi:hypothetical protein
MFATHNFVVVMNEISERACAFQGWALHHIRAKLSKGRALERENTQFKE